MLLAFPPGERSKTRATKQQLEDRLLDSGFDRHGCIVALGGGISLDLAGFIAATYMRGVDHVNIPTSLLAQVDACVGGKTGVNTPAGKNLIWAFHQPAAVLVDPYYLDTLPAPQWPGGLAELIKHAVIAEPELMDWLESHAADLCGPPWQAGDHPIVRGVAIKGDIVERDELEHGLRSVLNYGHTVGHALEKASQHELGHGQAVAIGMVVEGHVAGDLCGFPRNELQRLCRLLQAVGLPTRPPEPADFDGLLPFLRSDKKRRDETVQLALPA
ncbi:MAG: 3-dehydroquinate synthase, partial [Deltaproteobacteria bacterium]|nr:3-dehydroquinate synthase [Deltaproteobacteria bacterium]